jgi:serine/threonine protein kinase
MSMTEDQTRPAAGDCDPLNEPVTEMNGEGLMAAHDPDATVLVERSRQILTDLEQPGLRIGRYRLLEPLGEGGFGTVWLAEQVEGVTRSVALKIIKLGMDTREVIARFEQERQALAMMDHENIARVLDAGATDTGRPFFVMELVNGVPITKFCDSEKLGLRERLGLFSKVCLAISHAHQKGIIHRDIKPSNVLVSLNNGAPLVKVIDFGIAKATQGKLTDKTLFTSAGQIIGTPAYMSPEQAALTGLDVDTRSDIYSLGVLLYELLAGRPPFDPKKLMSGGWHEMCRIIAEVEPPKPSTRLGLLGPEDLTRMREIRKDEPSRIARQLRGDLDWIVMKALEKDRARRFETANDFAMDVRRFLANEPVLASPPSASYRLRKYAQRNKLVLAVSCTFVAVLVSATIISLRQANIADKAKQQALEREAKEREAREEAQAITHFITRMFQASAPVNLGHEITVVEMLDLAAAQFREKGDMPAPRRATLLWTVGAAYKDLDIYQKALPLLEEVRNHHLKTNGPKDSNTIRVSLDVSGCLDRLNRSQEATALAQEMLEVSRKTLGPEHPTTLNAMSQFACIHGRAGNDDVACNLFQQVVNMRTRLQGASHPDTLADQSSLGVCLMQAHRLEESRQVLEAALRSSRELFGEEHAGTLGILANLAACHVDLHHPEETIKLLNKVLPLQLKRYGPKGSATLTSMTNLAFAYVDVGRLPDALKLMEQVVTLRRETVGAENRETISALIRLGGLYKGASQPEQAAKLAVEALSLAEKVHGPEHDQTLKAMDLLGYARSATGRHQEAMQLREQVLALHRKVAGPEHKDTIMAMNNLAATRSAAGQTEKALQLQREAVALCRKALKPTDSLTILLLRNHGAALASSGQIPESITVLTTALSAARQAPPPVKSEHFRWIVEGLVQIYEHVGRKDDAAKMRAELSRGVAK